MHKQIIYWSENPQYSHDFELYRVPTKSWSTPTLEFSNIRTFSYSAVYILQISVEKLDVYIVTKHASSRSSHHETQFKT